ncbi:MAG: electron transport complex subunit RsxC, partial [Halobacteria archaeon]|nr:electron transport complex subunit RsxC [Halobacteria archaeon]
MKHKLWHFHGGLHLDGHKHMSMTEHVTPVALPNQVTLPLQQHIGAPAEPVVAEGEHVLKGQLIAKASDYVSAPVHASTSGKVIAIEERPVPHPSGLPSECIVIETDGKDQWKELKPVANYQDMDPSA